MTYAVFPERDHYPTLRERWLSARDAYRDLPPDATHQERRAAANKVVFAWMLWRREMSHTERTAGDGGTVPANG